MHPHFYDILRVSQSLEIESRVSGCLKMGMHWRLQLRGTVSLGEMKMFLRLTGVVNAHSLNVLKTTELYIFQMGEF